MLVSPTGDAEEAIFAPMKYSGISAPTTDLNTQIEAVANEAATSPNNDLTEPTQAQKQKGNYKKDYRESARSFY